MTTWLIATALALAGLVVTLIALFAGGHGRARGPREPDWLIPQPVEIRRARFPLAWRGYDPAHVDVYLDALAAAYEELYFTAGPSTVARAQERLALRLGHVTSETADTAEADPAEDADRDGDRGSG